MASGPTAGPSPRLGHREGSGQVMTAEGTDGDAAPSSAESSCLSHRNPTGPQQSGPSLQSLSVAWKSGHRVSWACRVAQGGRCAEAAGSPAQTPVSRVWEAFLGGGGQGSTCWVSGTCLGARRGVQQAPGSQLSPGCCGQLGREPAAARPLQTSLESRLAAWAASPGPLHSRARATEP